MDDLREKIIVAIVDATDRDGTSLRDAAERILAIPEIAQALEMREAKLLEYLDYMEEIESKAS